MSAVAELGARPIRVAYRERVRLGRAWAVTRDATIVRVVDAAGRVGLGETWGSVEEPVVAAARAWACGRTPADLLGAGVPWPLVGAWVGLSGAIEGALIDLDARQRNVTVAQRLAGHEHRDAVPVNALLVALPDDRGDAIDAAVAHVRGGYRTIKVKLEGGDEGTAPAWWRRTLRAIRDAVGSEVDLRVDLNGVLTPEGATAWLPSVADLGLAYVEQPIAPGHGVAALARLRSSGVPIAADEAVVDLAAAAALLETGACDALVVKPARVGGPLQARAIIEAARARDVPVTVSTLHETGVGIATALHVAATVPGDQAHGLASASLLADDPVRGLPRVLAGGMAVRGPGLGVTLG